MNESRSAACTLTQLLRAIVANSRSALPADGQDDRPDLDRREGIPGAGEDERQGGKHERQGEERGLGQAQGPQAGQRRQRSEPQPGDPQGREGPDGQQADRDDEPDGQDELEARVEAVDDAVAGEVAVEVQVGPPAVSAPGKEAAEQRASAAKTMTIPTMPAMIVDAVPSSPGIV